MDHKIDTLTKSIVFCDEPGSYGAFIVDLALSLMGNNSQKIFLGGMTEYNSVPEPDYESNGGFNLSSNQHFENILSR